MTWVRDDYLRWLHTTAKEKLTILGGREHSVESKTMQKRCSRFLVLLVVTVAACDQVPLLLGETAASGSEAFPTERTGAALPEVASCPVGQRDGGDGACVPEGTCSPGFVQVGELCGGWVSLVPMLRARDGYATATVLRDGRILIVGGRGKDDSDAPDTAELYDPVAGRVELTEPPETSHSGHTATLLPDGRVLVVGGHASEAVAEVFDPESERWTRVSAPPIPIDRHAATLLPDGGVIVTGGSNSSADNLERVFAYDPEQDQWSALADLQQPRGGHTAVDLPDGDVLVLGGWAYDTDPIVERYDLESKSWTNVLPDALKTERSFDAAVRLTDGRVFVHTENGIAPALIYDPSNDSWAQVADRPSTMSGGRPAVLALPSGHVLIASGDTAGNNAHTSLYDSVSDSWTEGEEAPGGRFQRHVSYEHQGSAGLLFGGLVKADESSEDEVATDAVEVYLLR